MNVNRNKVLGSPSPYISLFGVDGMGKGRPGIESKASQLLPTNELPPLELVGNKENAVRIRRAAAGRAMTALKALFAAEYRRVYKKELLHLAVNQAKEDGVELTPELAKKYGIELPARGVRKVSEKEMNDDRGPSGDSGAGDSSVDAGGVDNGVHVDRADGSRSETESPAAS